MKTSCQSCQNWTRKNANTGWCANFKKEIVSTVYCGEWRARVAALVPKESQLF
ncbi:MAG: hypothetical protein HQL20_00765 [Candidatus Omnitrophica bacterium]|nr:hypothetical protein [Candidatus Omnitrophota bacterium]